MAVMVVILPVNGRHFGRESFLKTFQENFQFFHIRLTCLSIQWTNSGLDWPDQG
jgi:hypothetical protein